MSNSKSKTLRPALPSPDDTLRRTLPNGITVLARENFLSPAVVIDGYLEVGAEDEPAEKAGLANFTVGVMERGTLHRSFDDLYEEVESVGANFGLSAGTHITSFGAKSLAAQLPLMLDILSDVLRYPAFPQEQVQRARGELLTALQERTDDTRRMATLRFQELAYPEAHPYHRSLAGYPETVTPLTRDELVAFHQRYFAPTGMVIVVVGAVKAEAAFQAVAEAFGDWEATRPARDPLPEVPPLTEIRADTVVIPEKTQSDIRLGWPGPPRQAPDFQACHLANTVLGVFGMMGRLGESVRSRNGLAYYAYSRIDGGKGPGPWRLIAGVNPANVEQAIALMRDEIREIRETPVPEEELNDSKSYLTGSLPLRLETNEGVAQALINIERYELGLDYLQRYHEILHAVTVEDVQNAAQRWLDPDRYALAVAGPELSEG
ncbi:MAG: M16 family metallopeptidase [Anaerolineae bacterium]